MPTRERIEREAKRDAANAVGEMMREHISRASMIPLTDGRRFAYPPSGQWPRCDCLAPLVPVPYKLGRHGWHHCWQCPLCDYEQFQQDIAKTADLRMDDPDLLEAVLATRARQKETERDRAARFRARGAQLVLSQTEQEGS